MYCQNVCSTVILVVCYIPRVIDNSFKTCVEHCPL